jgi:hypothetical protein
MMSKKDHKSLLIEAESFTKTQNLARLLGFERCYPLIFMTETNEASSSNVRLNKLMSFLKEILHEGKMISLKDI